MCIRDSVTVTCDGDVALVTSDTYPDHEMMTGIVGTNEQIPVPVSYTHLRAHETVLDLVCRLLLAKKNNKNKKKKNTNTNTNKRSLSINSTINK